MTSYRRLFETLLDPAVVCTVVRNEQQRIVDATVTELNEAARAILAPLGWGAGARLSEIARATGTSLPFAVIEEALEGQRAVRFEAPLGGREFLCSAYPLDGETWAGTWVDIGDRKRVEAALRESEERLQEALRISRSFAFEWVPATGKVRRSQGCASLLGLSGHDATDDTDEGFFRKVHRDDVEGFVSMVRGLRPGEDSYKTQYRIVRPDGRSVVVQEDARAYFDPAGRMTRLIGVTTDVTERELAEQERRKVEERLLVAKDAALLGVHDYDVRSGFVEWDSRVRELFGVDEDEPITYELFLSGVHPDDREAVDAEMARALDPSGPGRYYREYRAINRRDGQQRWVAATGKTFFEQGRPVRLIGTTQDITERKHVEEALRETDRRKNEFIAVLSHELRNPLAPIRLAVPILEAQALDTEGERAVSIIRRQADHLTRLVDDLLDVSRVTSGKITLRTQQVTLRSVLVAAMEGASPGVAAQRHTITVAIPDEPIWLKADPARLTQVIVNLLDNSAKYTAPGGEIVLEAQADGREAVIRVRDNGVGIPPDALETIFEMFSRLARPGETSGLGIGLAVARQLVEMHGGSIQARSLGPGLGAEFLVRLPLAEDLREEVTPVAEKRTPTHPLKVLVVDDNADLVEMLALVVFYLGYEVRKAVDGQAALSAVAAGFKPDVVLLDLGMPGMSGYEVARRLREDPGLRGVKLVALTGWGQPEDRERTRQAGFDCHLTKPADAETLAQILASVDPSSTRRAAAR